MSCHRRYASQMSGQSNYNLGGTMSFLNTEDRKGPNIHARAQKTECKYKATTTWAGTKLFQNKDQKPDEHMEGAKYSSPGT